MLGGLWGTLCQVVWVGESFSLKPDFYGSDGSEPRHYVMIKRAKHTVCVAGNHMGACGEALRRRKYVGAASKKVKMLRNFISDLRKYGWHTAIHNVLFMFLYDYSNAKHMHICYEGEDCIYHGGD